MGEKDYRLCVRNYTLRNLTKTSDSLNAFSGIIGYLTKSYFPNGLIWGMPLLEFPQSLRWYHSRTIEPQRRDAFPSWAWCGWQGRVEYSESLDLTKKYRSFAHLETDLTVKFVSIDDQLLTVQGYRVTLDIRTEPFSEAFVPDTNSLLGPARERDFWPHENRLTSGRYEFLVVERLKYGNDSPLREDLYLLLLERNGDFWMRRTQVGVLLDPGLNFEMARPWFGRVKLR
jgi:hypothetical protein